MVPADKFFHLVFDGDGFAGTAINNAAGQGVRLRHGRYLPAQRVNILEIILVFAVSKGKRFCPFLF